MLELSDILVDQLPESWNHWCPVTGFRASVLDMPWSDSGPPVLDIPWLDSRYPFIDAPWQKLRSRYRSMTGILKSRSLLMKAYLDLEGKACKFDLIILLSILLGRFVWLLHYIRISWNFVIHVLITFIYNQLLFLVIKRH